MPDQPTTPTTTHDYKATIRSHDMRSPGSRRSIRGALLPAVIVLVVIGVVALIAFAIPWKKIFTRSAAPAATPALSADGPTYVAIPDLGERCPIELNAPYVCQRINFDEAAGKSTLSQEDLPPTTMVDDTPTGGLVFIWRTTDVTPTLAISADTVDGEGLAVKGNILSVLVITPGVRGEKGLHEAMQKTADALIVESEANPTLVESSELAKLAKLDAVRRKGLVEVVRFPASTNPAYHKTFPFKP